MAASNKNKALTLDERRVIETGIRNGSTKTAIADTIGKDKSTVGKEIRRHRILKHKCTMPLECSNYAKCKFHRHCLVSCPSYLKFSCTRRDRSPGACNGCGCYTQCRFNKYYYDAHTAHEEYRKELVDSREGVNLTVSQAKEMAAVIGPLLKKGHSPYQIIHDNPGLGISEKTLYNYISQQVFSVAGIYDIDLRRKVSRRPSKKLAKTYKKRENRAFLKGREYKDFLAYRDEHPHAHILQMDTVYNDVSNGPFIQTFKFPGQFGTHIDFPGHFVKDGALSEAYGVTNGVFPLCVIDITDKVAEDMHYAVTAQDIRPSASKRTRSMPIRRPPGGLDRTMV